MRQHLLYLKDTNYKR